MPPGAPNPNPWIAIQGANSQTYTINGTDDMLYYFKVVATLDTCTEESPAILADGYAFGLPYLIATFQPGTYQFIGNGTYNVCNGASVLLENGFDQVYGLHTWYKCIPSAIPPIPGDPCIIQGATGDTITVTESGFYGFYCCTDYCPRICLFLDVPNFITLQFGNFSFCTLGIDEPTTSNNLLLYPNPTIQLLYLGKPNDEYNADILITDMMGKEVITIENYDYAQPIDVSNLPSGSYIIISKSGSGRIASNKFIKK
ncbi:T9SS type A sorting domain-containing protein [Flavobacterium sp.]|uniref:T9SS type A sorting domain-containing protein n=1 Tax=Flavobacterium sp. TaxID=239 RepID=UPI0022C58D05|nr:T9SS type A sorting domain-containing protein [Flavobacterium sp.]MCZ8091498.1 T9SS type A sorting domain-containing protein [Flavobacterium sp.]